MSEKTTPAMFQGVKVPPKTEPAPAKTEKSTATKTEGGAPVGRLAGLGFLPIVIVGLLALAAWSPLAALIVGGALVALFAIGLISRAVASRRVATTTKVHPDGTISTSTRPTRRGPRSPRSSRSAGIRRYPWSRNRDRSDRGGSRSRSRSFRDRSPGGGSPRGGPRGDGQPTGRRSWRDRMRPDRRDRNGAGDNKRTRGPAGKPPRGSDHTSDTRSRGRQWPWSRHHDGGSPGPRKPRSYRDRLPRFLGGPDQQHPGRKPKSPNGGSPGSSPSSPGRPKQRIPGKSVDPPGKHPSGWRMPKSDRTSGSTNARGRRWPDKIRDKWMNAWSDADPKPVRQRPTRADQSSASATDRPRRRLWPSRNKSSGDGSTASRPTGDDSSRDRRSRRLWRILNRPVKVPRQDFAAQLDERWAARGIGERKQAQSDPVVRPKPEASSDASAAFAEDWTPTPQPSHASRHSAEAGLMAEGDWTPSKPLRATPARKGDIVVVGEGDWSHWTRRETRVRGKGMNSTQGGIPHGQDASTAATRSAAYNLAANAAARVSNAKASVADAAQSQAHALSGREGMEGRVSQLSAEAGKARQDSSAMGAIAGKLRQFAANAANMVRGN